MSEHLTYTFKLHGFVNIVYVLLFLECNFISVHTPSSLEGKNKWIYDKWKSNQLCQIFPLLSVSEIYVWGLLCERWFVGRGKRRMALTDLESCFPPYFHVGTVFCPSTSPLCNMTLPSVFFFRLSVFLIIILVFLIAKVIRHKQNQRTQSQVTLRTCQEWPSPWWAASLTT